MGEFDAQKRQDEEEQAARIERRRQAAEARSVIKYRRGNLLRGLSLIAAMGILGWGIAERNRGDPSGQTKAITTTATKPGITSKEAENVERTPRFGGIRCYSERRTFGYRQTVFGLSTEGIRSDQIFEDAVYSLNLTYVRQQAKRNSALSNLNKVPIGTKVKILGDCIDYTPVQAGYTDNPKVKPRYYPNGQQIPNEYTRTLIYQNYFGSDHKTHHDVGIDYKVKPDGTLVGILDCWPNPQCNSFVNSTPTAS